MQINSSFFIWRNEVSVVKWRNVSFALVFASAFPWGRKADAAKITAILAATPES